MRKGFVCGAVFLLTLGTHGQTAQHRAAGKTLARKAETECEAQTPRIARSITAVVKETRVYSVFYSPRYTKCLVAVYLPINKELTAASLINFDGAPGEQHMVWENVFSKTIDAISELDRQVEKYSK